MFNAANAGRLAGTGLVKIGVGALGTTTGVGAGPSAGLVAWGLWNINSARATFARGWQQLSEAHNEQASDGSLRNLWGAAPFGQNFDDPWEPTPRAFFDQKIDGVRENPSVEKVWEIIKELGTLGG